MRVLGLLIGVFVGVVLIIVSKWFFIANFILVRGIMVSFKKAFFKCPNCNFVQCNYVIMKSTTNSQIVHGRRTKSGTLDKRYNSRIVNTETVEFGTECIKCGNTFKTTRELSA